MHAPKLHEVLAKPIESISLCMSNYDNVEFFMYCLSLTASNFANFVRVSTVNIVK